jgi:hypothetical protein
VVVVSVVVGDKVDVDAVVVGVDDVLAVDVVVSVVDDEVIGVL